ncbi:MAG: twin-arginine translocase subunit TatC [Candidatus Riflebacteria bacterium]|nr:twin-arginine translocase subunit TatC [Candidatus Riflebacteria bacterium]
MPVRTGAGEAVAAPPQPASDPGSAEWSHPVDDGPEEAVTSLTDHLTELRDRLLICLSSIGGFTVVCLFFSSWLIDWLKATAPAGLHFYTTNPTEAFSVYVKTAAVAGLVLSVPVISYHLWEFIRPGLHHSERAMTSAFAPAFVILFFTGALFARYAAVPMGVAFLVDFAQGIAEPLYTVGDYTGFVLQLMMICGILFEFPILLYMAGSMGFVTTELLRRKRRLVIFWIFVISAALTPSVDIGTQLAMAVPIVLLYEATILLMRVRGM